MVAALGGNALNESYCTVARLRQGIEFGLTRTLRQRPFVEAATLYGGGDGYIMRRHILPQVMPVLIVVATLQVAQMILQESALSFLGLGIPPPAATWGNILAEGSTRLFIAPWIANSRAGDHRPGLGRQHARQQPREATTRAWWDSRTHP
jgi:peptide/nickel transport system permease protein